MSEISVNADSLGKTRKMAEKLAKNVKGGEVIGLIGELGAGKTYFIKFFAEALGVSADEVISPTFVYWRKHEGEKFKINHFDMYRIKDETEVDDIAISDAMSDTEAVTIIEWADRIKSILPENRLEIKINYLGETERELIFKVFGEKMDYLVEGMK